MIAALALTVCGLNGAAVAAGRVENSIGVGLGLSYGGIGANYELGLNDYVALTVGAGFMGDAFGYNGGLRLYVPGQDAAFRVRASVLYGANAVYGEDASKDGTLTGLSAGLGAEWWFARAWALELDALYSAIDKSDDYELTGSEITVGAGLRFRF
jgi:opacity protein-like surface antigen